MKIDLDNWLKVCIAKNGTVHADPERSRFRHMKVRIAGDFVTKMREFASKNVLAGRVLQVVSPDAPRPRPSLELTTGLPVRLTIRGVDGPCKPGQSWAIQPRIEERQCNNGNIEC